MKRYFPILMAAAAFAGAAQAQQVVLSEDFNGDYSVNFPGRYDLDHQNPVTTFRELFMDSEGVAQPWWHLRDASTSTDAFIGSHSAYNPAGKSNDWLCSRALTIPTEGFVLEFGAQSYQMRTGDRLSDLWVFITEEEFDRDNPPREGAIHYEAISTGKSADIIEGDFTTFTVPLDQYAGKTIYLNFANLNTDKDILCLDNIRVLRYDKVSVSIEAESYTEQREYPVKVTIKGTDGDGLRNATLTFDDGNGAEPTVITGISIANGEEKSYDFTGTTTADVTSTYTATLSAEGEMDMTASGEITGMAFRPFHRVLMEETTGIWCGNCPIGIYTIESMMDDEEMKEKVIPVSIHIPGEDPLVNTRYVGFFNVQSAPAFRLDRVNQLMGFNTQHDVRYDPTNELSVAGTVLKKHNELVMADIEISGEFVTGDEGTDSIKCDITVTPAVTLSGDYGVGVILTENSVELDGWSQHNYYSGAYDQIGTNMGGWTSLPEDVKGLRWNEVARAIYGMKGFENSLPATMPCNEPQTYTATIAIPDTYEEGYSPAIRKDYTCVIAYIWDRTTETVVNSNIFPMTELAEQRYTLKDYLEDSAVKGIEAADETDAPAEYFNLQGQRVRKPAGGVFIEKKGAKASKRIFK